MIFIIFYYTYYEISRLKIYFEIREKVSRNQLNQEFKMMVKAQGRLKENKGPVQII
jgi:hypothetical protein